MINVSPGDGKTMSPSVFEKAPKRHSLYRYRKKLHTGWLRVQIAEQSPSKNMSVLFSNIFFGHTSLGDVKLRYKPC